MQTQYLSALNRLLLAPRLIPKVVSRPVGYRQLYSASVLCWQLCLNPYKSELNDTCVPRLVHQDSVEQSSLECLFSTNTRFIQGRLLIANTVLFTILYLSTRVPKLSYIGAYNQRRLSIIISFVIQIDLRCATSSAYAILNMSSSCNVFYF